MKTKIAVFGLPPRSSGKFSVYLRCSNGSSSNSGNEVFSIENDDTGRVSGFPSEEIPIGSDVTFQIMSTGIEEYACTLKYEGGDITHVPAFTKERNTGDDEVAEDWNLLAWNNWDPDQTHTEGVAAEHRALVARVFVKEPIQVSYYYDSRIDYAEKFHKLWIGLNAYASRVSTESSDKLKILSLVRSPLKAAFGSVIATVSDASAAARYRALQSATGVDMSSNILSDEIGRSNSVFDFMSSVKTLSASYTSTSKEQDGFTFLDTRQAGNIYWAIRTKYNAFTSSEQGIVLPHDLANGFRSPFAPESVERYGRLVFHNPFGNNSNGTLFNLGDYFGSRYAGSPYKGEEKRDGAPNTDSRKYENLDPLFFRYLKLLYDFRCAYFHGSLSSNEETNELARSAYTSLREIYPALLA
jgi:hypothetical protein